MSGIGAFVSGLTSGAKSGIGIRQSMDEHDLLMDQRKKRMEWDEEDRGYANEQRQLERDERNRLQQSRSEIDSVIQQGQQEFSSRVRSGEMSDADFENFWDTYTIPKLKATLLQQNDFAGIKALEEWADSKDARDGGKLFAESLLAAQTGDHETALQKAIDAGKSAGYVKEGYKITGSEEMVNEQGQVLGYRLSVDQGDGEIIEQDVSIGDIPQMIAVFSNPVVAFQSQVEAGAAGAKRKADMEDEKEMLRFKAGVKKPEDDQKLRDEAIKSLLKEEEGALPGDENIGFYGQPKEIQEQLINQRISVLTGKDPTLVPNSQMVVDQQSGKVVPTGIQQRKQQAQPAPQDVLPVREDEMVDLNWPAGAEDPGVTAARIRKQQQDNGMGLQLQ